jgi:bifunctional DNase/RNase
MVDSIRVSLLTQHRVVVLREPDSRRYLPIWIGPFEADAIAMAIQGHEPQRPLTHDLLKMTINEMGGTVNHVLVNDIHDNTFFARIVIEQHGRTTEQAGVLFDEEDQTLAETETNEDEPEIETSDETLSLFRDFIDTLDLNNPEKS